MVVGLVNAKNDGACLSMPPMYHLAVWDKFAYDPSPKNNGCPLFHKLWWTCIPVPLSLKTDKDYLLAGGVFTEDFIDNFIDIKYEEVQQLRQRPHPHEFFMYYDA